MHVDRGKGGSVQTCRWYGQQGMRGVPPAGRSLPGAVSGFPLGPQAPHVGSVRDRHASRLAGTAHLARPITMCLVQVE